MTHHVPAELQNYVRQSIIPQYANFDKAHQIDHVEKVIEESLKLATYYEVDYSMVYVIASFICNSCSSVNQRRKVSSANNTLPEVI